MRKTLIRRPNGKQNGDDRGNGGAPPPPPPVDPPEPNPPTKILKLSIRSDPTGADVKSSGNLSDILESEKTNIILDIPYNHETIPNFKVQLVKEEYHDSEIVSISGKVKTNGAIVFDVSGTEVGGLFDEGDLIPLSFVLDKIIDPVVVDPPIKPPVKPPVVDPPIVDPIILPPVIDFLPVKLNRDTVLDKFEEAYSDVFYTIFDVEHEHKHNEIRYLTNVINFGNDEQTLITTWQPDDITFETSDVEINKAGSIILKLYEPLSSDKKINDQLWISREVTPPMIENVILTTEGSLVCTRIRPANFSVEVEGFSSEDIGFIAFNDLVSSGSATSQNIIDRYIDPIIDSKKLGIDYTNYENFIHFSSAKERLENFRYKMRLIELYDGKLNDIDAATGSVSASAVQTERSSIVDTKNGVVKGFDQYEIHLYEQTGSTSWPKVTGTTNYHSTASTATTWFTSQSNISVDYDAENMDSLSNNLPEYIINDYENDSFTLFVLMIGQHFDILWSYIKALQTSRNVTHTDIAGTPDDLVYHMLSSLGWNAKLGMSTKSLWEYAFGTDEEGNSLYNTSLEDYNIEIWRRILNNLPYLLKHKGTSRAIKALITCYGIPASILSVREYSGQNIITTGSQTIHLKIMGMLLILMEMGTLNYHGKIQQLVENPIR